MADSELKTWVQRAVDEALERHLGSLRGQLVEQIYARLSTLVPSAQKGGVPSSVLSAALESIQRGTTQADILAALLQGAEVFSRRSALLVLRGGGIVVWRAQGFSQGDPKGMALDSGCALADRALTQRVTVSGPPSEFDTAFLGRAGRPAGDILLVPLLVREKVAALLYADRGASSGGDLDAAALDCLVRFAGIWIELVAARKSGTSAAVEMHGRSLEPGAPPFSGVTHDDGAELPVGAAMQTAVASAVEPFPAPAALAPEAVRTQVEDEGELHRKARRFARLLVDEIRLYNQEKVEEGRQKGDLYARLKVEIEKSRAAYDRRYGQSPAAPADYFQQELVRILANNNPALLGNENPS
jgi:hypothetical protein